MQNLNRNPPPDPVVHPFIDGAHTTFTEHPKDSVVSYMGACGQHLVVACPIITPIERSAAKVGQEGWREQVARRFYGPG